MKDATWPRAVVTVLLAATASPAIGQAVLCVDQSAQPGGDGQTWDTALVDLQQALASDSADEIWVAAGVYQPGEDRAASFCLRSGLAVYGGFGGFETSRGERDPAVHVSTLSGDLLGDDGGGPPGPDNSAHVVCAAGVDATAILDGFTITGGVGDDGGGKGAGGVGGAGGGLFIDGGSPTIVRCVIVGNRARLGAGVWVRDGSPSFDRCEIRGNSGFSAEGGGVYAAFGAGVYSTGPLSCVNCLFVGNRAVGVGCAGPECNGAPDVDSGHGGGVYATTATLIGCTLAGNWAAKDTAAAFMNGAIVNCIVWGNGTYPVCCGEDPLPPLRVHLDGAVDISFSDVEGLLQQIPGEDPPNPEDYPVVLAWGPCESQCPEDVNADGAVDVDDLLEIILNWG